MKKVMLASLLVVLALIIFTGVAGAQASEQNTGPIHDYMEKALAEKLGIPVATIAAQFDAGNTLYQIAIDNGIAQADLPALTLEVRNKAINAALADSAITQTQADKMLRVAGRGMGFGGMVLQITTTGSRVGPCGGTGNSVGTGMQRGGRWAQVSP